MFRVPVLTLLLTCVAQSQSPSFPVATLKPSPTTQGRDGTVTINPLTFLAHNCTLKRLISEAYRIPYAQITSGPAWLNTDEFDIVAKTDAPTTPDQLRLMLRALLAERFHLALHITTQERKVLTLTSAKSGPKLHADPSHTWQFHGSLTEFANLLAIQLTIPISSDPTTPTHASGPPIPVIDRTGIPGTHDLSLDLKPDQTTDTFTMWQRALQEQLRLKLESQKAPIPILVIDHAEKLAPTNEP